MAVGAAQPEIVIDPAGALVQEPVESQRVAIAIKGMQHVEPSRRRPLERAALQAELAFDRLAAADLVGQNVPIEYGLAGSRHGERTPLGLGAAVHGAAGAGEG